MDDPLAFHREKQWPMIGVECYYYLVEIDALSNGWTALEIDCLCRLGCTWYRESTREETDYIIARNAASRAFLVGVAYKQNRPFIAAYGIVALLA